MKAVVSFYGRIHQEDGLMKQQFPGLLMNPELRIFMDFLQDQENHTPQLSTLVTKVN